MPKLLIVTTIQRTLNAFLLPYSDYFRKKGWQVDALTGEGSIEEVSPHFDKVWTVNWSRNPFDFKNIYGTPKKILGIVEQEGYDIVHVHTPIAAFVTRYALRGLRRRKKLRVIYTAHGFHFYKGNTFIKNLIFLTLEKIAANWTDHLVVINEEDYDAALKHGLGSKKTVSLLPGIGLNLETFSPEKVPDSEVKNFRDSLGLGDKDSLFVMIAEFNPGKRHVDVLEAFSKLDRENAHLALVGKGSLEMEMRKKSELLGIADRVHFLGYRNEIPMILKAAMASILPSEREGMPRVIMESMSMGVPVIASKVRGNIDLLKDGGGFLFPVRDSKAIASIIKQMLKDKKITKKAMFVSKKTIKYYQIEYLLDMHNKLYFDQIKKQNIR